VGIVPGAVVTDGLRLYFEEQIGGAWGIAQVSVGGGDTVPVSTPFPNPGILDISPNGSDLLFISFTGSEVVYPLWDFPLLGGAPRRITNLLVTDATWSPDGHGIAYLVGADVFTARPDGTDAKRLADLESGTAAFPRWSPDGRTLRFTVYDSRNLSMSLWEVEANGSNLRPVLPGWNDPPSECCGNWTADGRYFVFESTRKDRTDIWALAETGGGLGGKRQPKQLTSGPLSFWTPIPSKDGKKLFVLGTQRRGELVRLDLKSGRFTPYLNGAFVKYPEGSLWRSKMDGSERLQISFFPMQTAMPRWSPDGKQIAFMGHLPGKARRIYLISADGGSPEELLAGDSNEADPDWSPDGQFIVFGGLSAQESGAPGLTTISKVELGNRHVSVLPGSQGLFRPRWSPDGKYIVAQTDDSTKLMLFEVTTQRWTVLAREGIGYSSWSADSQYIYFDSPFGSDPALYRVRASGGSPEKIASLKDFRRASMGLESWSGLAPDDSPLLLRDAGSQEIYAIDVQLP
jgi:Tol biopolymer transport system component